MKKKFLALSALFAFSCLGFNACDVSSKELSNEDIQSLLDEVVAKSIDINTVKSKETFKVIDQEYTQDTETEGHIYDNHVYWSEGTMGLMSYGQSASYVISEGIYESKDENDESHLYYIYDVAQDAKNSYKITMDLPTSEEEWKDALKIVTDETFDMVNTYFTEKATIKGVKKGKMTTISYEEDYVAPQTSNNFDRKVKAEVVLKNGVLNSISYDYHFFDGEEEVRSLVGSYTYSITKNGEFNTNELPNPRRYDEYVDPTIVDVLELPEATLTQSQITAYLASATNVVETYATSSVYNYIFDTSYESWQDQNENTVETTKIYGSGLDSVEDIVIVETDYRGRKETTHIQYQFDEEECLYGVMDTGEASTSYKMAIGYYQEGFAFHISNRTQNDEPLFLKYYNTYKENSARYNETGYKDENGNVIIQLSAGIDQVDNTVGVRVDAKLVYNSENRVTEMSIVFTSLFNRELISTETVRYTFGYGDNGTVEKLNLADFQLVEQ